MYTRIGGALGGYGENRAFGHTPLSGCETVPSGVIVLQTVAPLSLAPFIFAPAGSRVAEIGATQVGTPESRSVGKTIGEIGATKVSATQARAGKRHHPRISANEAGVSEIRASEAAQAQERVVEAGVTQIGVGGARPCELRAAKVHPSGASGRKIRERQARSSQLSAAEARVLELHAVKASRRQDAARGQRVRGAITQPCTRVPIARDGSRPATTTA